MASSRLEEKLRAYKAWKIHLGRSLEQYQPWLEEYGLFTEEVQTAFRRCAEKLASDRITVAFVGEFSRGKTELINALFFSDHGRRLLPSDAGRTTMCPTEIFYDEQADSAYLRLLPIETRLRDVSVSELRNDPNQWVELPLDLDDPEGVERCFLELAGTRSVSIEEAGRYGLLSDDLPRHPDESPGEVSIPKWRHAMISFPHPLLRQGMTVLDTPGLNAIGAEPELTLNMLPSAQAALFVLAADTGVTRSDLDMWQNHLHGHHRNRRRGLTVVLNKADTLWDELRPLEVIEETIDQQARYTARVLGVPPNRIFPVSAQKGLLGLVKKDRELLQRSGIPDLEQHLLKDIIEAKQQIMIDDVSREALDVLESLRSLVQGRESHIGHQISELSGLQGKSDQAIAQMLKETQEEQDRYRHNLEGFNQCNGLLKQKTRDLQQALDIQALDAIAAKARQRMVDSWTTIGLKQAMSELLQDIRQRMEQVTSCTQETRKIVRAIYRRFHQDHGFSVVQPRMFSIMPYQVELELLTREAEVFRNSPRAMLMSQQFLVKRFFDTLMQQVKRLFRRAYNEASRWLNTTLQPLAFQVRDHRDLLARQIQDLKRVGESRGTLKTRLQELGEEHELAQEQLTALRNMYTALSTPPLLEETPLGPHLVSNQASAR